MHKKPVGSHRLTSISIKVSLEEKQWLDEAAYKIGFRRLKNGEIGGDVSAFIKILARSLPGKSEREIKAFLLGGGDE